MKSTKSLLALLLIPALLLACLSGCGQPPASSGEHSSVSVSVSQLPGISGETPAPMVPFQPEQTGSPQPSAPVTPEVEEPVEEKPVVTPTVKPSAPAKPSKPTQPAAPTIQGKLSMRYDDRLDMTGKSVRKEAGLINTLLKTVYPANLPEILDLHLAHMGAQKYHLTGGTLHYVQVEQSGALNEQN